MVTDRTIKILPATIVLGLLYSSTVAVAQGSDNLRQWEQQNWEEKNEKYRQDEIMERRDRIEKEEREQQRRNREWVAPKPAPSIPSQR